MVAEAIFNSKIRYGISVYLNPIFDAEDLKTKKLSQNATVIQTLQNTMLRVILGIDKKKHTNMQQIREKIHMMSVNQMNVYHTILEAYNVVKNSSSEQIKMKWESKQESGYLLRSVTTKDLKIPDKPVKKCSGFSYYGSKLFNKLPSTIKETSNPLTFKALTKSWIWENIPSY